MSAVRFRLTSLQVALRARLRQFKIAPDNLVCPWPPRMKKAVSAMTPLFAFLVWGIDECRGTYAQVPVKAGYIPANLRERFEVRQ